MRLLLHDAKAPKRPVLHSDRSSRLARATAAPASSSAPCPPSPSLRRPARAPSSLSFCTKHPAVTTTNHISAHTSAHLTAHLSSRRTGGHRHDAGRPASLAVLGRREPDAARREHADHDTARFALVAAVGIMGVVGAASPHALVA